MVGYSSCQHHTITMMADNVSYVIAKCQLYQDTHILSHSYNLGLAQTLTTFPFFSYAVAEFGIVYHTLLFHHLISSTKVCLREVLLTKPLFIV